MVKGELMVHIVVIWCSCHGVIRKFVPREKFPSGIVGQILKIDRTRLGTLHPIMTGW